MTDEPRDPDQEQDDDATEVLTPPERVSIVPRQDPADGERAKLPVEPPAALDALGEGVAGASGARPCAPSSRAGPGSARPREAPSCSRPAGSCRPPRPGRARRSAPCT